LIDGLIADPDDQTMVLLSAILYSYDGRVYPASFAALPKLAAVARRKAPAQRFKILELAGNIISAEDQLPELGNIWERYSKEISTFLYLTRESLATPDCSTDDFIYLLQATLAFEGEPFWGYGLQDLLIGKYEVYCPNCRVTLYIAIDEGFFTAEYDFDPYDDFEDDDDWVRIPLQPASPEEFDGLGKKLYETSCRYERKRAAELFSYLFGKGVCTNCNAIFSVSEQVFAIGTEIVLEEPDDEP
jgi:hypothetical protein